MGWDRRPPVGVKAPVPPVPGRWVFAAIVAVLAGALLFLLHASERLLLLQTLDIWLLSAAPLLVLTLAFGARAHGYGVALSHYRFLEAEAQKAQRSWQGWAQRYLAVSASCVLLPDQVSASVLMRAPSDLPSRAGQARRITALPAQMARAQAGLQLLIQAIAPALEALPAAQELRVTLLSDVDPAHYDALRSDWQQIWSHSMSRAAPTTVSLVDELSYRWGDETLKAASTAIELLLILQVHGEGDYSDGLAALLLCPDSLAHALKLPITAYLLRPMPLDIEALDREVSLLLTTQLPACKATGLLADDAAWQPRICKLLTGAGTQGASLVVEQQWIQEHLCGRSGPLGHWLVTALGVEVVRHQRSPLLVLAREKSRHWVGTVTTGELA
jgi:hypothetical protein